MPIVGILNLMGPWPLFVQRVHMFTQVVFWGGDCHIQTNMWGASKEYKGFDKKCIRGIGSKEVPTEYNVFQSLLVSIV